MPEAVQEGYPDAPPRKYNQLTRKIAGNPAQSRLTMISPSQSSTFPMTIAAPLQQQLNIGSVMSMMIPVAMIGMTGKMVVSVSGNGSTKPERVKTVKAK